MPTDPLDAEHIKVSIRIFILLHLTLEKFYFVPHCVSLGTLKRYKYSKLLALALGNMIISNFFSASTFLHRETVPQNIYKKMLVFHPLCSRNSTVNKQKCFGCMCNITQCAKWPFSASHV